MTYFEFVSLDNQDDTEITSVAGVPLEGVGAGADEGNLLIDEGGGVGGIVPPELLDIAVALNEDRV